MTPSFPAGPGAGAAGAAGPEVRLRPATAADAPLLAEMLLAAFAWTDDRDDMTIAGLRSQPEVWHYVDAWPRAGDLGVVAVSAEGEPLGASWCRLFAEDDRGYGFVSTDVPELSMGVAAAHRGRGLGGRLLDAVVEEARGRSLPGVSLSVEDGNDRARALYERRGFVVVGREGDSDVILLAL